MTAPKPKRSQAGPWVNYIPRTAVRSNPWGFKYGWFLLFLEDLCGDKDQATDLPPNHVVAGWAKCSVPTVERLYRRAASEGRIRLVFHMSPSGQVTGRIGFILLKRLRPELPVAAADMIPTIEQEIKGKTQGARPRPRVLPFKPPKGGSAITPDGHPTAINLMANGHQSDGQIGVLLPCKFEITSETTTTEGESSSSFSSPSIQDPEPESAKPELTEAGINQALLAATIVRVIALSATFAESPNWSREQATEFVQVLVKRFPKRPFWWIYRVVGLAQKRGDPLKGREGARTAGWAFAIMQNWDKQDFCPSREPTAAELSADLAGNPSRAAPAPPPHQNHNPEVKADGDDQDSELRAAWERLSEAERAEIRAAVKAANPVMARRWTGKMLESCYLGELGARIWEESHHARE